MDFFLIQKIIAAILVGYLLGAIPCAYIAGKLRGVDVFATGSRLGGTANVFWNIGRWTGTAVFVGDVAKGAAAVIVAQLLGVPPVVVFAAAGAAVLGHWISVFSGFRGGDGMATLLGITLVALEPPLATVGVIAGVSAVLLMRRSSWRSCWGVVACFTVLLSLSLYFQMDREMVTGLTGLAVLVLLRSIIVRRRIAEGVDEEEILLDLDLEGDSDLGPTAQENR